MLIQLIRYTYPVAPSHSNYVLDLLSMFIVVRVVCAVRSYEA